MSMLMVMVLVMKTTKVKPCDLRIGLSAVSGDCDDTNILISPSAVEICDEIDNDCNNEIDEGVSDTFI